MLRALVIRKMQIKITMKHHFMDLPGSPVVKIHSSILRGTDSIPGEGTKIPQDSQYAPHSNGY